MRHDTPHAPWWLTLLIVVLMSPVLGLLAIQGEVPPEGMARTLIWLYPAYVIATGICAWLCWPQRKEVTWILLLLLVLSHLSIYVLLTQG